MNGRKPMMAGNWKMNHTHLEAIQVVQKLGFRLDAKDFDRVDVVVHGRHSHERQPRSHLRRRLIATRHVPALAADPTNPKAWLWNPAGASLAQALAALGAPNARIGVVGGTEVFGLFLDLYDVFHLSRAAGVRLPGGRPVFPGVPAQTPEDLLAAHGMIKRTERVLDDRAAVVLAHWSRA